MTKKIILNFVQKDNIYVAEKVELEREFFLALKENGFITHASSFEDLPATLEAEIHIVDEDLSGNDKVDVMIYTNHPIPEEWKNDTQRYLNRDLIKKWDNIENIECMFSLNIENVSIVQKRVSIMIDIPM